MHIPINQQKQKQDMLTSKHQLLLCTIHAGVVIEYLKVLIKRFYSIVKINQQKIKKKHHAEL